MNEIVGFSPPYPLTPTLPFRHPLLSPHTWFISPARTRNEVNAEGNT